jgi:hypothetical protein
MNFLGVSLLHDSILLFKFYPMQCAKKLINIIFDQTFAELSIPLIKLIKILGKYF